MWVGNKLGGERSNYYVGALKNLSVENQWTACEDVFIYLVGRNNNNGFYKMSFLDSIIFPMVEGVIISVADSSRAVCISQHGGIRVFR